MKTMACTVLLAVAMYLISGLSARPGSADCGTRAWVSSNVHWFNTATCEHQTCPQDYLKTWTYWCQSDGTEHQQCLPDSMPTVETRNSSCNQLGYCSTAVVTEYDAGYKTVYCP
jgi:hypothetical protein